MSINNISDIYSQLSKYLTGKTSGASESSSSKVTNSDSGNKTQTDTVELNSELSSLAGYLNYNSSGNYTLPNLADFIDKEDGEESSLTDFLGDGADTQKDLADFLNSDSTSDDSQSGIFDSLIQERTEYTDNLIKQAEDKLNSKNSSSNINTTSSK